MADLLACAFRLAQAAYEAADALRDGQRPPSQPFHARLPEMPVVVNCEAQPAHDSQFHTQCDAATGSRAHVLMAWQDGNCRRAAPAEMAGYHSQPQEAEGPPLQAAAMQHAAMPAEASADTLQVHSAPSFAFSPAAVLGSSAAPSQPDAQSSALGRAVEQATDALPDRPHVAAQEAHMRCQGNSAHNDWQQTSRPALHPQQHTPAAASMLAASSAAQQTPTSRQREMHSAPGPSLNASDSSALSGGGRSTAEQSYLTAFQNALALVAEQSGAGPACGPSARRGHQHHSSTEYQMYEQARQRVPHAGPGARPERCALHEQSRIRSGHQPAYEAQCSSHSAACHKHRQPNAAEWRQAAAHEASCLPSDLAPALQPQQQRSVSAMSFRAANQARHPHTGPHPSACAQHKDAAGRIEDSQRRPHSATPAPCSSHAPERAAACRSHCQCCDTQHAVHSGQCSEAQEHANHNADDSRQPASRHRPHLQHDHSAASSSENRSPNRVCSRSNPKMSSSLLAPTAASAARARAAANTGGASGDRYNIRCTGTRQQKHRVPAHATNALRTLARQAARSRKPARRKPSTRRVTVTVDTDAEGAASDCSGESGHQSPRTPAHSQRGKQRLSPRRGGSRAAQQAQDARQEYLRQQARAAKLQRQMRELDAAHDALLRDIEGADTGDRCASHSMHSS